MTCRSTSSGCLSWKQLWKAKNHSPIRTRLWRTGAIYTMLLGDVWHKPRLDQFALHGGGDQGGLSEKPTHPKPLKELIHLGFPGQTRRVERSPEPATMEG
jgi:hypothetical protein